MPLTETATSETVTLTKETSRGTPLMPLSALCDFVVQAAQFCAGVKFYSYQKKVSKAIVESVLLHDGSILSILQSRQSGKTEAVASTLFALGICLPFLAQIFPEDWRLNLTDEEGRYRGFRDGVDIGVYGPSGDIVSISAAKMYGYLQQPLTEELTRDMGISVGRIPGGGIGYSNGSSILFRTAERRAKKEGHSYHVLVLDECQDIDSMVIVKSLHPFVSSTNGCIIKVGTACAQVCDFYNTIQANKRMQAALNTRQLHYEFDYKVCGRENSMYRAYVEREKVRLGEDSDEFQLSYCVVPETRVLTADLRYIPAGDVKVGAELIGFDEFAEKGGHHRKFRKSAVLRAERVTLPCCRVELDDGSTVTCSSDHQWLVITAGRRTIWKKTVDLEVTDRIYKVCPVWDGEKSYEAGYLAGVFDGEGCLAHGPKGRMLGLSFAQKENALFDQACDFLDHLGYSYSVYGKRQERGVIRVGLAGGRANTFKFLGSIRPARLLEKFDADFAGAIGRHDFKDKLFVHPRVRGVESVGSREVVALQTTTKTYVAEGLASHNCCKFILERGMFITDTDLTQASVGLEHGLFSDIWPYDLRPKVSPFSLVAGLDFGKASDSTVLTIGAVDWENPQIDSRVAGAAGIYRYQAFEKHIVAWEEWQGDNFEKQFKEIHEYLERFLKNGRLAGFCGDTYAKICVDATGLGSVAYDRLAAMLPWKVVPFMFSRSSKSDAYKLLSSDLLGGRMTYPASERAKESRLWRSFMQQMLDLRKNWEGGYMVVAHEDAKYARDDYADSLSMMNWTANQPAQKITVDTVNLFSVGELSQYAEEHWA